MSIILDGTTGITSPNDTTGNQSYTGTLTGGTGVVNLGSGQFYKDASGNVGIGTSSPSSKLHILSASAESVRIAYDATHSARLGATSVGDLQVYSFDGSSYRNILLGMDGATAGGSVLVGTTTNTRAAKFRVYKSGDNVMETETDNAGGGYIHIGFVNPNGRVGAISTSGSSTTYSTTSDYRLKENIAPMSGALATVSALNPITYKWKVDGSPSQGFIAHELQAIVPDCVVGEKDAVDEEGNPKYQSIDTSFLVATLTAAIQEQQALIESLTTRLTALELK